MQMIFSLRLSQSISILLLLFVIGTSSCVTQNGSYNSAQNYIGHFEGKHTGQIVADYVPAQSGISATGAYALNKSLFVQTKLHAGATSSTRTDVGPFNFSSDLLVGGYWFRHKYQCLTAGIGGGTGVASFKQGSVLHGRFQYHHTTVQIGISENYGPSRLSLGLGHRATNFYSGKIYIGRDISLAERLSKVVNQRMSQSMFAHIGWSRRLSGSLRLRLTYDFTFYGMDYNLYDRDQVSLGMMYDLGKMSRPTKPPKLPKKYKSGKQPTKKHLED
jgi:hypothetical protein